MPREGQRLRCAELCEFPWMDRDDDGVWTERAREFEVGEVGIVDVVDEEDWSIILETPGDRRFPVISIALIGPGRPWVPVQDG